MKRITKTVKICNNNLLSIRRVSVEQLEPKEIQSKEEAIAIGAYMAKIAVKNLKLDLSV